MATVKKEGSKVYIEGVPSIGCHTPILRLQAIYIFQQRLYRA